MSVELLPETEQKLRRAAAAAGADVNAFTERLLVLAQNQRETAEMQARRKAIDAQLEYLATSPDTSGRDGRPWREFLHEGHKY